jgi:DNA polymerase-3 subunit epsilon
MTLILAWDTETSGFVNDHEPPSHPSQPHLVQLGAVLLDEETGLECNLISLIVKPDGWVIPDQAAAVHHITTGLATRVGVPLLVALAMWSNLAKLAQHHVAHNAQFDLRVLQAAFHRAGRPFPPVDPRCTKQLASPVLNLPPTARMLAAGFNKPKDPTLTECVRFFFDEDLVGAHGALADARACGRVYLELVKRGVVK